MNKHAQALGKLAKGKRKRLSPEVIERKRVIMAKARESRWKKEAKNEPES